MSDNTDIFTLPAQVTVDGVEEIREQLIKFLQNGDPEVKICGDDVASIDAAGLQLLLAFYKSCAKEEKRLVIIGVSPVLKQALTYTGTDKVITVEGE